MHFQPCHAKMEASLPLQYNHQVLSPKSGHFNASCKLMLSYLPTLKPYSLYCNHVKTIVTRSYEGRRSDPFVMQKHAPSQRKGENIANIITIFYTYLSCFCWPRVCSTMLTTTRHNYSTNVDQVKFGKREKIETHKDNSPPFTPL